MYSDKTSYYFYSHQCSSYVIRSTFSSKCTKYRVASGLLPDLPGDLSAPPIAEGEGGKGGEMGKGDEGEKRGEREGRMGMGHWSSQKSAPVFSTDFLYHCATTPNSQNATCWRLSQIVRLSQWSTVNEINNNSSGTYNDYFQASHINYLTYCNKRANQ